MERKIGEIFNIDNEWYQVVKSNSECCKGCAFYEKGCKAKYADVGSCGTSREDWTQVIFKKLEKVGEPFTIVGKLYQHYKAFDINNVCGDSFWCVNNYNEKILTIEIKQNKEYMEESVEEKLFCDKVAKANAEYMKVKLNSSLKPFDIEAAKSGKPVCTSDGRKARIVCFDRNDLYPIVALIECEDGKEMIGAYSKEGRTDIYEIKGTDLMMLPEKKEGWVNIYKGNNGISERVCGDIVSNTKEEATQYAQNDDNYITTIKIEWRE